MYFIVRNRVYVTSLCHQQPRPHSPTGDLGEIAGQNSEGEVSLAQVSSILMYVYVAPPTPVGGYGHFP